uniref:Glycosyl hydrolase family 31 C-terminal domain-containing protein n=1 Tax=Scylla olivacea TaxID=85551 RepID=A0A0P4W648_SCYOL
MNGEGVEQQARLLEKVPAALQDGSPLITPLALFVPHETEAIKVDDQWMLGDDLLVAPVTRRGMQARDLYLPKGIPEEYEGPFNLQVAAPNLAIFDIYRLIGCYVTSSRRLGIHSSRFVLNLTHDKGRRFLVAARSVHPKHWFTADRRRNCLYSLISGR